MASVGGGVARGAFQAEVGGLTSAGQSPLGSLHLDAWNLASLCCVAWGQSQPSLHFCETRGLSQGRPCFPKSRWATSLGCGQGFRMYLCRPKEDSIDVD